MKVSLDRLIISHLVVAGVAFHMGVATSVSPYYSTTTTAAELPPPLLRCKPNIRPTSASATTSTTAPAAAAAASNPPAPTPLNISSSEEILQHSVSSKDFIHGMVWTPRSSFRQHYDVGYALEKSSSNSNSDEHVLILYESKKALPSHTKLSSFSTIPDAKTATENCNELAVMVVATTIHNKKDRNEKQCIAIMPHWGPSAQVHHFSRNTISQQQPQPQSSVKNKKMKYVSHYFHTQKQAYHWNKDNYNKRKWTAEAWKKLSNYIQHYDEALEELRPIAAQVAIQLPFAHQKTIMVLVTNIARIQMVFNLLCAAAKQDLNLPILVFALDQETYDICNHVLGIPTYYNGKIFADIPSGEIEEKGKFGDMIFARTMIAKVYCVHMVNDLGYDVLFSDTDVVPLKSGILEYFYNRWRKEKFDIYFQYDKNGRHEQSPFSANTGFYFVKHNSRTNYLLSMLVRMEDLILRVKSHQQVMMHLVAQLQSSDALRVKVLGGEGEDHDLFPSKLVV